MPNWNKSSLGQDCRMLFRCHFLPVQHNGLAITETQKETKYQHLYIISETQQKTKYQHLYIISETQQKTKYPHLFIICSKAQDVWMFIFFLCFQILVGNDEFFFFPSQHTEQKYTRPLQPAGVWKTQEAGKWCYSVGSRHGTHETGRLSTCWF